MRRMRGNVMKVSMHDARTAQSDVRTRWRLEVGVRLRKPIRPDRPVCITEASAALAATLTLASIDARY